VLLHHLAGPPEAFHAQPVEVDPALPIRTGRAEDPPGLVLVPAGKKWMLPPAVPGLPRRALARSSNLRRP